ncbi:MAG TPA: hypothetical protein VNF47_00715 [Streptosporangiaceae bacterium]|nr:hypothetical protein [Streptosporangiaceae bacterium]
MRVLAAGTASMTGRVKVVYGFCGRLLCHVTVTPRGVIYHVPAGRGWDTDSPYGVRCPDGHGRPDLTGEAFARRLARHAGGSWTAKMMPWPPAAE